MNNVSKNEYHPDEESINDALHAHDLKLPKTFEEVRKTEIEFKKSKIILPEILKDYSNVFKERGLIGKVFDINSSSYNEYAQAAREGGEISEEVRNKMIEDRQKAEKNKDAKL